MANTVKLFFKKAMSWLLILAMIISIAPITEITANAASPVMTAETFVAKAIDIAENYKTLYVMGCFGSPLNSANKKRYTSNHSYNEQADRTAMINNASSDTFGFDCVCLIKGILWGWNGDLSKTYGGAKYGTNGVPDISADAMINVCSDISTDFSSIEVGEAVWLKGHIGIYIGDGLAVECTPKWDNCVQITACNRTISGYNRRNWTKHGKLPYVSYSGEIIPDNTSDNPDDYPEPTKTYNYWNGAMTGDEVKWIQAVLCKLGYSVSIDGSFGPSTEKAIKRFQSDHGLEADGSAGPATRAKLKECWEAINDEPAQVTLGTASIVLGLTDNRTQTVTGRITGNYAHWQNDWDGSIVGIDRTVDGSEFTWTITARSAGVCDMILKAQDEKYNTIAEASIRITVSANSNDIAAFNYNTVGGTPSVLSINVNYGGTIAVTDTIPKKAGYSFVGWNVLRDSDNTWATEGHGWLTDSQLEENGIDKQLFGIGSSYGFDYSWTNGLTSMSTYTFTAVWDECTHSATEIQNQIMATCEKDGYSGDEYCSACGMLFSSGSVVPKTGHDYRIAVIPPSINAQGYAKHTCSICGDSYNDTFTDFIPANQPVLTIENKEALVIDTANDTVSVSLIVDNAPEFKTLALSDLTYDNSVLELVSFEWNTDGILKNWNGTKAVLTKESDADMNGKIITLTFKVKDDCIEYEGNYTVLCAFQARKSDGTELSFLVAPGTIALQNAIIGDLDGNGKVDEDDAIHLLYYTFFPEDYPINQSCDYDKNGKIDEDDAMYLLFYTFFPDDYPLR